MNTLYLQIVCKVFAGCLLTVCRVFANYLQSVCQLLFRDICRIVAAKGFDLLFNLLLTICKMFAFFVPFSYICRIYSEIMCRILQRDRRYSANTIFLRGNAGL